MTTKRFEPIHPGEILEEEFMIPLGLSANALAKRLDVPVTRISEIVRGNRGVTADTALRLARLFGTSSELWLGLQAEYDLRLATRDLAHEIQERIVPLRGVPLYDGDARNAKSTVSERAEPYGVTPAHRRTRDRRRIRRKEKLSSKKTSTRPRPKGHDKKILKRSARALNAEAIDVLGYQADR